VTNSDYFEIRPTYLHISATIQHHGLQTRGRRNKRVRDPYMEGAREVERARRGVERAIRDRNLVGRGEGEDHFFAVKINSAYGTHTGLRIKMQTCPTSHTIHFDT